jgi:DNA-binding transcriptional LysR family regulator
LSRPFYLVYHSQRMLPPAAQAFLELLRPGLAIQLG